MGILRGIGGIAEGGARDADAPGGVSWDDASHPPNNLIIINSGLPPKGTTITYS